MMKDRISAQPFQERLFIANALIPNTRAAHADRRTSNGRKEIGVDFGVGQTAAQQVVALLCHTAEDVQHSKSTTRPKWRKLTFIFTRPFIIIQHFFVQFRHLSIHLERQCDELE